MSVLFSLAGPLLAAALTAQPVDLFDLLRPSAPSTFRQGTQAFRRLFPKVGFTEPLERVEDLANDPASKLLVVFGDTTVLDRLPHGVDAFLNQGGALLIATDRASQANWTRVLGLRLTGRFVRHLGLGADSWYHGPDFPYVMAVPGSPLFAGIDRVATNRPSYLQIIGRPGGRREPLRPLAKFVDDCAAERAAPLSAIPGAYFAAGDDWGRGRVLVLADHSVFINEMLLRQDERLNNLPFAVHCLNWLHGPSRRSQVLFVDEGGVVTNFQESLALPLPPPEALVPLLNSALRGFEEENAFNEALMRLFGPDRLLLGALCLVTLMLVGYGFLRLGKKRHRVDKESPGLAALLARQPTSAAVVEQRHQAMLAEGNLWEAARALARQCLDDALGEDAHAEVSLLAAEWGEPPQVHVAGGWWRRWRRGQEVRRLWQLAYDPVPVPVSPGEFTHLTTLVRQVWAELADGTVRIEPPAGA